MAISVGRSHWPETNVLVNPVRVAAVPVRGSAVLGAAVPEAATAHPGGTRPTVVRWVLCRQILIVGTVTVPDPLIEIAMHVIKTPGIGKLATN